MERIEIAQRNYEDLMVEYDRCKNERDKNYRRVNDFRESCREEVFEYLLYHNSDSVTEMWYDGKLDESINNYLLR